MPFVTPKRWDNKRWTTEEGSRGSRMKLWGVPASLALDPSHVVQGENPLDGDDEALIGPGKVGRSYDLAGGDRLVWREVTKVESKHPLAPFEDRDGELDHLAEGGCRLSCLRLARVPDDPTWRHRLEFSNGASLIYQPALTPHELSQGFVRPAGVVGSYAVYDVTGCKIAHVLRPCALSANRERRAWGAIEIVDGVSTVRFAKADLQGLGPNPTIYGLDTFGYTSIGASEQYPSINWQHGYYGYSPAGDGNATDVYVYCVRGSASTRLTCGVFSDSGGAPANLLRDTGEITPSGAYAWNQTTLDSPLAVVGGTTYHAGINTGGEIIGLKLDGRVGYDVYRESATYSAGALVDFSSPAVWVQNQEVSVYVEYTPAATGSLLLRLQTEGLFVGSPM